MIIISCETTIFPELGEPEGVLVVDAWINNNLETQEIYITRSQQYFDNSVPPHVSGAEVYILDLIDNTRYDFVESGRAYVWEPSVSPLGEIGHIYQLVINVEGTQLEAYADLSAVPPIDSIKFSYNPEDNFIDQEYYLGEFLATDLEGEGDTYWIKSFKNGTYLNKPNEINIAFDAGFSEGGLVDNQVFIQPIQNAINPIDEDPDGNFLPPFLPGDSVYVEIHSTSIPAFDFLSEMAIQTDRPGGFAELFATPLANVSTNIVKVDPDADIALGGFFNIAAISSRGRRLTSELADEARAVYEAEN